MTDKPEIGGDWKPALYDMGPLKPHRPIAPVAIDREQALWDTFRKALLMLVDGIERYLGYTDEQRTAEIRRRAR